VVTTLTAAAFFQTSTRHPALAANNWLVISSPMLLTTPSVPPQPVGQDNPGIGVQPVVARSR
jgi:hypothetical protein